jgi:hypothetical protein
MTQCIIIDYTAEKFRKPIIQVMSITALSTPSQIKRVRIGESKSVILMTTIMLSAIWMTMAPCIIPICVKCENPLHHHHKIKLSQQYQRSSLAAKKLSHVYIF